MSKFDQMDLDLFGLAPTEDSFTNVVEFYDQVGKFVYGKQAKFLESGRADELRFTRLGTIGKVEFRATIRAGGIERRVKAKGGGSELVEVFAFPGAREELVDLAIRKLITEGRGFVFHEPTESGDVLPHIMVRVTLSEIAEELGIRGHQYSIGEIREALTIMNAASLEFEGEVLDKVGGLRSPFYPVVKKLDNKDGSDGRFAITLHPVVSQAIAMGTFRRADYEVTMRLKHHFSRALFPRLVMRWVYASAESKDRYSVNLTTLVAALKTPGRLADDKKLITLALQELVDVGVMARFEFTPKKANGRGRVITDWLVDMYSSSRFGEQQKIANAKSNTVKKIKQSRDNDGKLE